MAASWLLLGSGICLFVMLLRFPRTEEKQPLFLAMPCAYLLLECFACSAGGVLTAFGVPADAVTIGLANLSAAFILWIVRHRRQYAPQRYDIDLLNAAALFVCFAVGAFLALQRFTPALRIDFETSDPAIHLQMAMDSLTGHTVLSPRTFMYEGNFTNGLFLQLFLPFFGQANAYRIFLLRAAFNLILSAMLFYACARLLIHAKQSVLISLGTALFYFLGYPLIDFLFGFNYLGMTINLFLLLFFVEQSRQDRKIPPRMAYLLLAMICQAIGVGYTLLAPVAFFALFCSMSWDYVQKNRKLFQPGYFKMQLSVFAFPTVMTMLYYFVIIRRFNNVTDTGALMAEGYIYRNLYSDFVLLLPLALTGLLVMLAQLRNHNQPLVHLTLWTLFETLGLLYLLAHGKVSSYYYFKINFLIWPVLWLLAVQAFDYLLQKAPIAAVAVSAVWVFLFGIAGFQLEYRIHQRGIQVTPDVYTESETWFRNYSFCRLIYQNQKPYSTSMVTLYQQMLPYHEKGDGMIFLGNWLDCYWAQAISGDREKRICAFSSDADIEATVQKIATAPAETVVVRIKDKTSYLGDDNQIAKYDSELEQVLTARASVVYENDAGWLYQING